MTLTNRDIETLLATGVSFTSGRVVYIATTSAFLSNIVTIRDSHHHVIERVAMGHIIDAVGATGTGSALADEAQLRTFLASLIPERA